MGFSGFYLNRRSSVCPRAWLGWTWLCQPECFTLVGLLGMYGVASWGILWESVLCVSSSASQTRLSACVRSYRSWLPVCVDVDYPSIAYSASLSTSTRLCILA